MQISNSAVAALVHDVMVASAVAAAVVLHIPLKQLLSLLLQSCPLLTWLMFLLLLLLLSSSSPSSSSSWLLLMLLLVLLLMFFSLEASRAKSLILQKLLFLPVINAWNNLGRFKKRASSVFNVGYFAKKLFSSSRKKEPGKCFFFLLKQKLKVEKSRKLLSCFFVQSGDRVVLWDQLLEVRLEQRLIALTRFIYKYIFVILTRPRGLFDEWINYISQPRPCSLVGWASERSQSRATLLSWVRDHVLSKQAAA